MRRGVETFLLRGFRGLAGLVPYRRAAWVARLVTAFAAPVLARPRVRALDRIEGVLPALGPEGAREVYGKSVLSLARTGVEWLYMGRLGPAFLDEIDLRWEGREHLDAVADGGIVVGGHLGNWEILGALVSQRFPGRLTVVGRTQENSALDEMSVEVRRRFGMENATRDWREAPRLAKALQAGGVLGLVSDQHASRGTPVQFLGKSALAFPGPAALALRVGRPIVVAAVIREGWGRFTCAVAPPIQPEGETETLVQAYSDALSSFVRRAPGQWLWLHDRWKGGQ